MIATVFGDHAGGLDRHHRHGVAGVIKRQVVLADVGGLDGDAFTHAHGAHLGGDAVVVEAVLPDAFVDEAVGLVAALHHGADEPAGGGGLGGVEWWRGGIHIVENLKYRGQTSNVWLLIHVRLKPYASHHLAA